MSDGRSWHQFDIAFAGSEEGKAVLVALAAALPRALARGELAACFFMQKSPGLRLRLAGADAGVNAVRAVITGSGISVSRGVYEPETYLFDGPAALRCAHDAFTADTLAICRYAAATICGAVPADPVAFSLALCEQLIVRLGFDAWEAWDIWMRVLTLRGGAWQDVTPRDEHPVPVPGYDAILADYVLRIDRLAAGLAGAARAATFPSGFRRVLPFWIVFHWNRMGFDHATQLTLASSIAADRHPRARCEHAAAAWA